MAIVKINDVFNSWVVLDKVEKVKGYPQLWFCECVCGNTSNVTQYNLISGASTKCRPCSQSKRKKEQDFFREDHMLYSIWKNMKSRINNPNRKEYDRYGGRGIKICDRWYDFLLFLEDMESSFQEGLTLDRINNDGDYEPNNCRWSTHKEQNNNQRTNLKLVFEGLTYTESQLSEKTGVKRTTIQTRRNAGWSVEEMVYGKNN